MPGVNVLFGWGRGSMHRCSGKKLVAESGIFCGCSLAQCLNEELGGYLGPTKEDCQPFQDDDRFRKKKNYRYGRLTALTDLASIKGILKLLDCGVAKGRAYNIRKVKPEQKIKVSVSSIY